MPEYSPFDWYWAVDGEAGRYWSSLAGNYVRDLPAGAGLTRIASEAELTDVLAAYGLPGPIVARRRVDKWSIVERVNAAGKAAVLLNLPGNEFAKFRWLAPIDSVFFDDPDTVAMVTALDLDPEVIMAPDAPN